jgi:glycosyltransferase involved in cell wall biosynthesis
VRLLALASYGGAYSGSFIPMLSASFQAASAAGWECHAVFPPHTRGRSWVADLDSEPVTCHFIPSRPVSACLRALSELLDDSDRPTVMHTHFSGYDLAAAVAAWGRAERHAIWHLHSEFGRRPAAVLRNSLRFGTIGRTVASTLCVAPQIAAQARWRGAANVKFFPNAIQTRRFSVPSARQREVARQRLGLGHEAAVLLHFGWAWERKGGPEFLATAYELLARGTALTAVTVGGGDSARACAQRLGIAKHVRVLEPAEGVEELYRAADVFLAPSRSEGMPFALTEALCSGVAAVVSPLTGHRLLGADVETCLLCPPDPRAMADAVTRLLARPPNVAAAQGARAHEWVAAHIGLERWAERLLDEYRIALGDRASA